MSANRHLYLLALALTVIGVAIFLFKWRVLHFPLQPNSETQVWNVEAAVTFDAGPSPVKATLRLPTLTPGYTVLDENFVSRGFGVSTQHSAGGREAVWAIREAQGTQTVFYRATVLKDPTRLVEDTTPPFPAEPTLDESSKVAMEGLLAEVRRQSADVTSFTTQLLKRIQRGENDSYIALFLPRGATAQQRAQLATVVLAAAHIPARVAHGVLLRKQNGAVQPMPLLEVHDGVQWSYFNPVTLDRGLP